MPEAGQSRLTLIIHLKKRPSRIFYTLWHFMLSAKSIRLLILMMFIEIYFTLCQDNNIQIRMFIVHSRGNKEGRRGFMKNLLVTGGCGFIGSNFIKFLLESSDFKGRVINVDKLTYAGNPENLSQTQEVFSDRYIFIKEDICNKARMEQLFDEYEIDSVCHLAAESHVDRSIVSPDAFIQTNIFGTFNLLEASRSRLERVRLFHHISTDEVFGSLQEEGYFTEKSP